LESVLKLEGLTKKYKGVLAVDNLSINISKGKIYGLLGPNGSGKSTTLGMVLNVVNKTSGNYKWFDGSESTHEALKRVGAIIERPNFYPSMTAEQNLALVCKIKGIDKSIIDDKLKLVNLLERKKSKFKTFSLGMKQRLAIASALLNDPDVLILDEPTNGLDPQGIHEIRGIIKTIASKGTTIVLASHLLDEVEKVCTDVLVIQNGVKLYEGKVDAISSTLGYFEVAFEGDLGLLVEAVKDLPSIGEIKEDEGMFLIYLKEVMAPSDLNKHLFNKGIVLSHLAMKKPSLEQQFLDLTRK